jgi:tetratricopeptide (TPR) repeat protein
MKHSLEKDRQYLNWHNHRGIAYVISRGHCWFKEKYLPAIHRLEEAGLKKDRFLLSNCYYMIGDVHDFNNCPKTAIKAYKKSFEVEPSNSAALREMGIMYETIGCYKKAASLLKKAIQINPHDELAVSDYKYRCSEGPPLYRKGDVCWQAREYLAQDKPKSVLKLLEKRHFIPALQIKACACGILNDTNAILEQWSKIADAKETIEVTYADWFYMPDAIPNSSKFWEKIAHCAKQNRFTYSIWPTLDSLYGIVVPFPSRRKRITKADLKRCNKCSFLLAQYHIARINRDLKLAGKLHRQYPKWPEIEKLFNKLSR